MFVGELQSLQAIYQNLDNYIVEDAEMEKELEDSRFLIRAVIGKLLTLQFLQ